MSKLTTSQKEQLEKLVLTATVQRFIMAELQRHVHASTICRDIKALKAKSQQFVYDLAKSDLAYYYKQCIEGIDEANRESWKIYHDNKLPIKELSHYDNVLGELRQKCNRDLERH